MALSLKIFGQLKETIGVGELSLDISEDVDIDYIVGHLISEYSELSEVLIDPVMRNPKPNSLILLNGVEINNLEGLKTKVSKGSELVFLSVTHGG